MIIVAVKNFFINVFIYVALLKIINDKEVNYKRFTLIIMASIITTVLYILEKMYFGQLFAIIISYFIQILFMRLLIKDKNITLLTPNLISNSIVYAGFGVATTIETIPILIFNYYNKIVNTILILIIEALLLYGFFRLKRFRNGMSFLKDKTRSEYIDIIMINVSAVLIFAYCLFGNYYGNLTRHILVSFIILGIIMFIMIQKTLILYYKQKMLEKTLEEYKEDIAERDKHIQELSDEKFKISKVNHEFYNRQKALELAVKEFVSSSKTEVANEIAVIDKINNLSNEYSSKIEEIKNVEKLPATGIEEVDEMFKYMQNECINNKIDFNLKINGNIFYMVNNIIDKSRLVTLIGDHIRDAIIAINNSSNKYKSIVAVLGMKDNCYEFCVYDTGIEFEIPTLLKLGLEPATTHKDSGGTGIGFITTFETLNATKASLIIQENHEMLDNDYTKAVIIRFDGKNEYRIKSYRANKIKKNGKDNRIIIEKL